MPVALTEAVVIDVKHATTAGDYLPFTALPKAYHGGVVALVLLHRDPEPGTNQATNAADTPSES